MPDVSLDGTLRDGPGPGLSWMVLAHDSCHECHECHECPVGVMVVGLSGGETLDCLDCASLCKRRSLRDPSPLASWRSGGSCQGSPDSACQLAQRLRISRRKFSFAGKKATTLRALGCPIWAALELHWAALGLHWAAQLGLHWGCIGLPNWGCIGAALGCIGLHLGCPIWAAFGAALGCPIGAALGCTPRDLSPFRKVFEHRIRGDPAPPDQLVDRGPGTGDTVRLKRL